MIEEIAQSLFALDEETATDEGEDYKASYYKFFNGISAVIENMQHATNEQTIEALKYLQCCMEDFHIVRGEDAASRENQ